MGKPESPGARHPTWAPPLRRRSVQHLRSKGAGGALHRRLFVVSELAHRLRKPGAGEWPLVRNMLVSGAGRPVDMFVVASASQDFPPSGRHCRFGPCPLCRGQRALAMACAPSAGALCEHALRSACGETWTYAMPRLRVASRPTPHPHPHFARQSVRHFPGCAHVGARPAFGGCRYQSGVGRKLGMSHEEFGPNSRPVPASGCAALVLLGSLWSGC